MNASSHHVETHRLRGRDVGLDWAQQPPYEIKANLFKGLAHPFRIRILELLAAAAEVSVAEMLADLQLEASHLSQHLSVLRRHRLVASERRGSNVYYRLTSPNGAELLRAARHLLADLLDVGAAQQEQAGQLPDLPGSASARGSE